MQNRPLHIISFDNPFPPDYGGVIDVFFKIRALHKSGHDIYLHCFVEDRDQIAQELRSITKKIWFYKKNRNPFFMFSKIPFAVKSRFDSNLVANINSIDAPILFEGLQATMLLNKVDLGDRKLLLRLHNIESAYFSGTAKSEKNWFRKFLYFSEAVKYRKYEKIISRFDAVFALSVLEHEWVQAFSGNSVYVPVFHGNEPIADLSDFGYFSLYHGDLRLADNRKSAEFLINAFKNTGSKFVVASGKGEFFINSRIKNASNIEFIKIKNQSELDNLLQKAHINVLVSFQQSGTKLKLVNSLFKSRFCLINRNIVDDPKIMDLCETAETEADFINKIRLLSQTPFHPGNRKSVLDEILDDTKNARKISEFL
jgi:hypothetical protein